MQKQGLHSILTFLILHVISSFDILLWLDPLRNLTQFFCFYVIDILCIELLEVLLMQYLNALYRKMPYFEGGGNFIFSFVPYLMTFFSAMTRSYFACVAFDVKSGSWNLQILLFVLKICLKNNRKLANFFILFLIPKTPIRKNKWRIFKK